jgi:hypothetical protein
MEKQEIESGLCVSRHFKPPVTCVRGGVWAAPAKVQDSFSYANPQAPELHVDGSFQSDRLLPSSAVSRGFATEKEVQRGEKVSI